MQQVGQASEAIIDWSDEKGGGTALKKIFEEDIQKAEQKGLVPKGASEIPVETAPTEVHISAAEKKVLQKSVAKSTLVQGLGLVEKTLGSAVNNLIGLMTGTLNMAETHQILSEAEPLRSVQAGAIFIFIGLALKMALVPLHLWLPDAYTYAPSAVTAFLAAAVPGATEAQAVSGRKRVTVARASASWYATGEKKPQMVQSSKYGM